MLPGFGTCGRIQYRETCILLGFMRFRVLCAFALNGLVMLLFGVWCFLGLYRFCSSLMFWFWFDGCCVYVVLLWVYVICVIGILLFCRLLWFCGFWFSCF